jgi:thioredoxin-related protein
MKLFLLVALDLLSLNLLAQDGKSDFEEAKIIASEKDQNILLVFSGSDWCAPCIKLEKTTWHSQEFIDFSTDHLEDLRFLRQSII